MARVAPRRKTRGGRIAIGSAGDGRSDGGVDQAAPDRWTDAVQRRHLRRNYAALALDGGFYAAGVAFVAMESVFPALLRDLGGPNWLIALAPYLSQYGLFGVPLLTLHWMNRLERFLPFVAWVSVPQRLPPLFAGLALLFAAGTHPQATLWVVALAPVLIGIVGGANSAAFWELVAKTLPANRRASNLAVRNILGTALGFAAGGAIAAVLARWPGPRGFGVLYLCNFACFMLSLAALVFMREAPHAPPPGAARAGPVANLGLLRTWFRTDAIVRHYVLARLFGLGINVLTPFLAIHAIEVLGSPPSFLGTLVAAQMAGSIGASVIAGWLGDRSGGRIVALLGGATAIGLSVAAAVTRSEFGFVVIFFALGLAIYLSFNGAATLLLELFAPERRPTCFALVSFTLLPSMLLCAWLAALTRHLSSGAIWPAAAVAAALLLVSQVYFHRLPEPRAVRPAA